MKLADPTDIPFVNRVLNSPDVYRHATAGKDVGPLDISNAFSNLFVLLEEDKGCVIFDPYSTDIMEVHTCLLPAARGTVADGIVRDSLRFAFAETGCLEILTKVHQENKAADLFTRQVGFVRISDTLEWKSYQFTIDRWPYHDAELAGLCPDDLAQVCGDVHERRIWGAFLLMGSKGFLGKGVSFYNKQARLHGYMPMVMTGMDSVQAGGVRVQFDGSGGYQVEFVCPQPPSPAQGC